MLRLQLNKNITKMAVAVITFACISCQEQKVEHLAGSEPQGASSSASRQAPFDVEAVIRQVHFSYRQEQDGWHGGHSTYDVKATAQGLTLTPVHARHSAPQALKSSEAPVGSPPPPAQERETGASLFLGTAKLARGDTLLSAEAPRGQVEADGHLTFQEGAVVEHLRNTEQGVEQSWSFEQAPGGTGELRVTIPVSGLVYTRTTEDGLHFADARTGLGFRYGHGTWVDGQGRRTAVRAEYAHGQIQLRVPERVLAESTYPAVLDPVISYEMIIDGRLVDADLDERTDPALAFNGTNYFVAWRDTRGTQYNIYGTRVSSTGTVLDSAGIVVGTGPGNSVDPQVASNGTDFYVVWSQFVSDDWVVRGTRVTGAGVVSEIGGSAISQTPGTQNWPHVASNGTDYLVTWYARATDGYYNVYARRISSTGASLDTSDIPIATGENYDETSAVVASNGTVYLVAWSDERSGYSRAYATRVSNAGVVLDGTGFTLSSNTPQYMQAIASNGSNFFVVWLDWRNSGSRDLYGTRVTDSGTVVDGSGLAVGISEDLYESFASVASDGSDYFAAWTAWDISNSTFQNLGCRVSASASSGSAVLDTTSLVLSANAGHRHPAVAPASSGYFVAWDGSSGMKTDLYTAWVSSAGSVSSGSGVPVSSVSSLSQTEPVVASNGSTYLVVWTDVDGSTTRIYGTRVSPEGGVLDVPGLQITSTAVRERQSPEVTSNGTDYFVTWMDFRDMNWDIYGARVLGTGSSSSALLDPEGFAISTNEEFQNSPVVSSDGTDYFVAWRQETGGRGDIYGARVTSAGEVQDTDGVAISTNVAEHYTPRVAFNGSNYLVVWAEAPDGSSWDIHGARVTTEGEVLDTTSIVISSELREQYAPDVTSNGSDYFVVWTDYRSGDDNDIYGARVSGAGVVLDSSGVALCTDTSQEYAPRVAFDGTNYVAVWADYRYGSSWDVFATQVSTSGTVVTSDGFSVVYGVRETEPYVSVASAGGQQSLAIYSRYDTEPGEGSRRVRGSFLSF